MPDGAVQQKVMVRAEIPRKLAFLMERKRWRWKVLYGGRAGMKTRTIAKALLMLGATQKLRILCGREFMASMKESVHQELCDTILELGLEAFYTPTATGIIGANGTEFMYVGLHGRSVESMKSYANIDICWVEEAQNVTKNSWNILEPTIRAPFSEIWVSFNPGLDTDETWKRFVVRPQPDSIVVKTTYKDNRWFPTVLENGRATMEEREPEEYDNIWLGNPRRTVRGAIFRKEVIDLIEGQRFRPVPYNPRYPVHAIWDLGWNDSMAIVMAQKTDPTTVSVINYLEVTSMRYDEIVAIFESLHYRWAYDWLPHDGENHHPTSGMSAKTMLIRLNRVPKIIEQELRRRSNAETRIRAARNMFPRVLIDDGERELNNGYLGGARLLECLRRYHRNVPETTLEPSTPVHDEVSHGCDAFGSLAEIIDQITGDFEIPQPIYVEQFYNPVPGTGLLG